MAQQIKILVTDLNSIMVEENQLPTNCPPICTCTQNNFKNHV